MERISNLEKEIAEIRETLHVKEKELYDLKKEWHPHQQNNGQIQQISVEQQSNIDNGTAKFGDRLPKWAIERYSRQILLPQIGVGGQERLCKARVLVVGAGGLGCPAALYLAGAGVGEIGIVDYDTVDLTNIHRQVLHGESDQNVSKVESAAHSLRNINSRIRITPYNLQLDSSNALEVVSKYDIVLDCTDNVPTRYLLNDACVLTKLPLISGSALKMEGQITIYGYRASRNTNETDASYIGPCYRCVFPAPPPAETVGSCSASGVAGPVPAVIGALQALEAIKYIVGQTHRQLSVERMLLFDGEDMTFRMVKLRPQHRECAACSEHPSITKLLDYEVFCKSQAKEKDLDLEILPPEHRISAQKLASTLNSKQRHLLVDVRSEAEFSMCSIDGAVNWPVETIRGDLVGKLVGDVVTCERVTFICRRGNDSQIAAKRVLDAIEEKHKYKITDLTGGLHAWAKYIDTNFPVY